MSKVEELYDAIYMNEVVINIVDKYGFVICEISGMATDILNSGIIIEHTNVINIDWDMVSSVEKEIIENEAMFVEYTIYTPDYSYVIDVM